jgi:hypothetical protein
VGRNNRQRRAAKAKRRVEQSHRRASARDDNWSYDDPRPDEPFATVERADALFEIAASPRQHVGDEVVAGATEQLYALDRGVVSREAERYLVGVTEQIWDGGWQPAELVRQVQRAASATAGRLARFVLAAEHARRETTTLDVRWIEQLDRLALPTIEQPSGWLDTWAASEPVEWRVVVETVVAYLRTLVSLTTLPILIPPPGTRTANDPIDLSSAPNDPLLERVRALLAQAESTTFEAEAEAFTAKAQELMTRHAIDRALVAAHAGRSEGPITIRLPIDDPYVDAKSVLLHWVAQNSRCRSVFHGSFAMCSVVGFAADVAATEVLFTSLLVQAQTAMQAAAATAPPGARARSRSFRSAFLVAYADRIGERLAEINAAVVTDVEARAQRSILPVLAARSSAVDEAVDEMFGKLRASNVRGGLDPAGWASGRSAADNARLAFDLPAGEQMARTAPPRRELE